MRYYRFLVVHALSRIKTVKVWEQSVSKHWDEDTMTTTIIVWCKHFAEYIFYSFRMFKLDHHCSSDPGLSYFISSLSSMSRALAIFSAISKDTFLLPRSISPI